MQRHALLLCAALVLAGTFGCDKILGIEEFAFVAGDANVTTIDASADFVDADLVPAGGVFALSAAGGDHTCALLISGGTRCWGLGGFGNLGYGDTANIGDDELPSAAGDVNVGGSVIAIRAGRAHTCAELPGGGVRCWGSGEYGALGYGNLEYIGDDELPTAVGEVDVGGSVAQVTTGDNWHSCALLSNDNVRCWGRNTLGNLGYGHTENIGDDELPSSAGDVDVGGAVTQISAGTDHTCAVLSTGSVRCWGSASAGKLGYGNIAIIGDDELPSSAGDVNVGGTVTRIAAGGSHTCALLSTGKVRCWGSGSFGALGYGNTENIGDDELPFSAGDVDVGGAVIQIAAGTQHTCALLAVGTVRCWGLGASGQLGYGNTEIIGDDELPTTAGDINLGGVATQIVAGGSHTCALLTDDNIRCWGEGLFGKLGYGNTDNIGDDELPASAGDVCVVGTESSCP